MVIHIDNSYKLWLEITTECVCVCLYIHAKSCFETLSISFNTNLMWAILKNKKK